MCDLRSDTQEAQVARFEQLKGKNLLWLTCYYTAENYDDVKPLIQGVVDLGVQLHVVVGATEADKGLGQKMTADGIAAGVVIADMSDDATACNNIYDAAMATGITYDAVFSPHEVVQTLIGELSERMSLPGNTAAAFCNARDKRISRQVCTEANIPSPRYGRITTEADIERVVEHVGLPLVLKPSAGAASEGVYKCSTLEEVRTRFLQIEEEAKNNPTMSWNPGLDCCILCEEYIDGAEFDIDLLLWDGGMVYGNVVDNWPTMEPTFLETGSNCPSVFSPKIQQQLIDYSLACVKALGFKQGCFHVECKYSMKPSRVSVDEDGDVVGQPLLIEVNPRMGGGRTHYFHKNVFGVDLFDNFLMTACGIPINPPEVAEPIQCLADYDICAEKTGILLHSRWLDHVKAHPQMLKCEVYVEPGTKVKGADTGIPEWLGVMILKGSTPEEVVSTLRAIIETVNPPISPVGAEKEMMKIEKVVEPLVVAA